MSVEYKLSLSDRISDIATLSNLITGNGCWNVTEEIEQCQAPKPSLADDETEEISRFPNEIFVSESGIHVVVRNPLSFRKLLSLKVDFGRFLESLPSNSAIIPFHERRSFPVYSPPNLQVLNSHNCGSIFLCTMNIQINCL
jgi:hypothetical protein